MGRNPAPHPGPFALAVLGKVKTLMDAKSMSGRELGRQIDQSESYIRARLAGEIPLSLQDIDRIADALGVEIQDLVSVD